MSNVNLGSVRAQLELDTKKWDSAVKGVQAGMQNVSQSIKKQTMSMSEAFNTIGKTAKGLGKTLSSAVTAPIIATGVAGIKTAGQLETYEIGFKTLLGSAEKAGEAIAMIKKDAASTPFEIAGLTQANLLLTTVTRDAGRSETVLLNIGKALAAMGKGQAELDRVIINLQQIAQTGKITELDIRQFGYAGINILKLLADYYGVTEAEASDMVKESKNAFADLEGAFNKAGGAGGEFADAFINAGGSFEQLWSNMKDSIIIFLSDFVKTTGIFDNVKAALTRLIEVMGTLTAWLNKQSPAVKKLIVILLQLLVVAGPVLLIFGTIATKISGSITALKSLRIAIKRIGIGFATWLVSPIGLVIIAIVALATATYLIYKNWAPIKAFFISMWAKITSVFETAKNGLLSALNAITKAFNTVKDKTIQFFIDKWNELKDFIDRNKTTLIVVAGVLTAVFGPALIKTGINAAVAGAKIVGSYVKSLVLTGKQAVITGIKLAVSFVKNMVQSGIQAVKSGVLITGNFIKSLVLTSAQAIKTGAVITANFVKSLVMTGAQIIKTSAIMLAQGVVSAVAYAAAGWSVAVAWMAAHLPLMLIIAAIALLAIGVFLVIKYWEPIKQFFINLWESIKGGIVAAWEWIKNIFLNYTPAGLIIKHWDTIAQWFSNLWAKIKQGLSAGWELIKFALLNYTPQGLIIKHWSSIAGWFSNLWGRIKNGVVVAWNWIKNLLLNYTPQGLIIKHWSSIVAWFGNLWNGIKDKFSEWVSEAYNWGKNLVISIGKGITDFASKVWDAVKGVANKIKGFLGFGSPTKEGPGKEADKWIPNLMNMMTEQLNAFVPKFSTALSGVTGNLSLNTQPTMTTAKNQAININIGTLIGDDSSMRELERRIAIATKQNASSTGSSINSYLEGV